MLYKFNVLKGFFGQCRSSRLYELHPEGDFEDFRVLAITWPVPGIASSTWSRRSRVSPSSMNCLNWVRSFVGWQTKSLGVESNWRYRTAFKHQLPLCRTRHRRRLVVAVAATVPSCRATISASKRGPGTVSIYTRSYSSEVRCLSSWESTGVSWDLDARPTNSRRKFVDLAIIMQR